MSSLQNRALDRPLEEKLSTYTSSTIYPVTRYSCHLSCDPFSFVTPRSKALRITEAGCLAEMTGFCSDSLLPIVPQLSI